MFLPGIYRPAYRRVGAFHRSRKLRAEESKYLSSDMQRRGNAVERKQMQRSGREGVRRAPENALRASRIAPDRKKVPIIYEYWNSPRRKLSYHFCSPLRLVTRTVSVPKRNPLWYYSPSDRTVPQPEKTFIRTKENVSVTMKFSFFFF